MGYKRAGYYGAYSIYSDDGGKTWRTGYDRADSSGRIGYIEGTLAELPDGTLHINYRDKLSSTPGNTRLHAESADGGTSFSAGFRRSRSLLMHSVEGSAFSPQGTHGDLLLFSAPTYTNPRDRTLRRDMGVFVSRDGGSTFGTPYPVELESKPGAYSDLVQLSDGVVGVLYETGTLKWRERIAFRRLSIADIRKPFRRASTAKGTLSATRVSYGSRPRVKVVVRVPGSTAPPGRFLVRYRGSKKSGVVAASFTYSNRGVKSVTLPRLPRGKYRVSVTYKGNVRIAADTATVGTLYVR
jgi:sialidase-1